MPPDTIFRIFSLLVRVSAANIMMGFIRFPG